MQWNRRDEICEREVSYSKEVPPRITEVAVVPFTTCKRHESLNESPLSPCSPNGSVTDVNYYETMCDRLLPGTPDEPMAKLITPKFLVERRISPIEQAQSRGRRSTFGMLSIPAKIRSKSTDARSYKRRKSWNMSFTLKTSKNDEIPNDFRIVDKSAYKEALKKKSPSMNFLDKVLRRQPSS
ncbi:hypothetical protein Tcan_15503 [Toxocara canis]|uniref:Uncharacterized protein n=1 Tax=Toxocara canis TaxID=6265 RepID=A0A0B2UVU6_TOXCA|nr:hypothetical protein Tcan_15503 [Toxocara canis]